MLAPSNGESCPLSASQSVPYYSLRPQEFSAIDPLRDGRESATFSPHEFDLTQVQKDTGAMRDMPFFQSPYTHRRLPSPDFESRRTYSAQILPYQDSVSNDGFGRMNPKSEEEAVSGIVSQHPHSTDLPQYTFAKLEPDPPRSSDDLLPSIKDILPQLSLGVPQQCMRCGQCLRYMRSVQSHSFGIGHAYCVRDEKRDLTTIIAGALPHILETRRFEQDQNGNIFLYAPEYHLGPPWKPRLCGISMGSDEIPSEMQRVSERMGILPGRQMVEERIAKCDCTVQQEQGVESPRR